MATTDLCTLEEVKNYMGISGSNSDVDDLFEVLINNVTTSFSSYCGINQFKAANYIEYLSGDGVNYIFLINTPINNITYIAEDSDWVFDSDTYYEDDEYAIIDDMVVLKNSIFPKGVRNLKVSYNGGYATIPKDLNQACIEEVVRKYKKRSNVDLISKSTAEGGFTKIQHGMLKDTIDVLKKYKARGVV